jgi:ribosomal protein S18 acetylase RimI-like enzyme
VTNNRDALLIDPAWQWPVLSVQQGAGSLTIERMTTRDAGHVLNLDAAVFRVSHRWKLQDFCHLRRRAFVARFCGLDVLPSIVGFVVIELGARGQSAAKIVRLAVHPDKRRLGLGGSLIEYLTLGKCVPPGCEGLLLFGVVSAHVPDDNLAMHSLLRKTGFRGCIGGTLASGDDYYYFERPAGGFPDDCVPIDGQWSIGKPQSKL